MTLGIHLSSAITAQIQKRVWGKALGVHQSAPSLPSLIGSGMLPSGIGYLGETRTFSTGMILAGTFILIGPFLIPLLRFDQHDDHPGC